MSHNATGGAAVTVRSLNAGLASLSAPSDSIPAASGTLSAGTAGYGLCAGSGPSHYGTDPSEPGSASPDASGGDFGTTCTSSDHNVGLLSTDDRHVWATSGPTLNAYRALLVKAAISPVTPAHDDYSDTLTLVMSATY
jgi:hypothetical protein